MSAWGYGLKTRDGNIEGFVDQIPSGKPEKNRKPVDNNILLEELVDTITTEELVDTIITRQAENHITTVDGTISLNDSLLYTGGVLVSNGVVLLHAAGIFPFRSVRLPPRFHIGTMPYLLGGLPLIILGRSVILFNKMNTYLFKKKLTIQP